MTIYALWLTAFLTAVIHTITGPDHYLPFIAIAKSRDFSLKKTLLWTFICGLGHIGSALLIALGFVYLCPASVLAHWIYLVVAGLVLVAAYVLFMRKNYHLHEEYLASLKR